ncbi:membrane-associated, eicosanoid/glutathione metabolism protein [Obelidium mucronatum]|nr:membrane-associated, eicosanoid/glutathione metabolism protein [Obelidium mucronatum]
MPVPLPVTGVWSTAFVGLGIVLQAKVILYRRQFRISIGDGTKQLEAFIAADKPAAEVSKFKAAIAQLALNIRVHANYAENVPLALFVIAVAELNGIDPRVIHGFLAALFVGRLAHWWTVSNVKKNGAGLGRVIGVMLTANVTLAAALASAWKILF